MNFMSHEETVLKGIFTKTEIGQQHPQTKMI